MVHWNNKQYIAIQVKEDDTVVAIALDSNFKLRSDATPFKGETSSISNWLDTLNIKANGKGEAAGIKALCYGQTVDVDNVLKDAILNNKNLNYEVIDVSSIINYFNDNDGMHVRKISFPKMKIRYVASQLKIDEPKGSWQQVMEISLIYKKLTERGVL